MPELITGDAVRLAYDDTGAGPVLVFVHGWAMSGRVWRYQREQLAATHRVISLDLRGHGASSVPATVPTMNDFAGDIAALLTRLDLDRVTLVAWSLGVSATLRTFPAIRDRISGLVLVGGTPRFTAGDGFAYGLPPEEVRGMALRLNRQYGRTMEEFFRGMFAENEVDSDQYRQIVQDIVKGGHLPESRVALGSLDALASADLRPYLAAVDRPTLLIHGGEDRICLPDASRFMADQIHGARFQILPGVGHAPFLSRTGLFNSLIRQFAALIPRSPAPSPQPPTPSIDRDRVRAAFHCHAAEYETYASVQRQVVTRLLAHLDRERPSPRSALDIGCGTGMLLRGLARRFPDAALAGIDLAPGMVAAAVETLVGHGKVDLRPGDAEQLPFKDGSFDLVVSTSTFQWLEQLDTAFAEAYRVLAPGGSFRFALFGKRTLHELKESYRAALRLHGGGTGDRTHRFLDAPAVAGSLEYAGFEPRWVWSEDEIESHPDVPALLRSLKRIGAGNASANHPKGLADRRVMLAMMDIYAREYGRDGTIPATYEVIYGWGVKEGCAPRSG